MMSFFSKWKSHFVKRDAYLHPTVDESEEPFKWGLPDLDALRQYVSLFHVHYNLYHGGAALVS
jgi:hypothetical protein